VESNKLPQRKTPRLKDFDYSLSYVYFLTTCTKDKKRLFIDHNLNLEVIDCLLEERERLRFKIFCYCLMPDHFHLLLTPGEGGQTIPRFMGGFKSKSTRACWKHGIEGKVWQGRYYDHILRKEESIKEVAEYILNNPVRKRLVEQWKDYKYCGFIEE